LRAARKSYRGRLYNALLYRRHGLPVWSALFLASREADSRKLTGALEIALPSGQRSHQFTYQVVRMWEKPLASVLDGGIGMLPTAPLCDEAAQDLPAVIEKIKERLDREPVDRAIQNAVWTSTYFLMGLRYNQGLAARLIQGVRAMAESVTFLATIAEGARRVLLKQGRERFGPPDQETLARLEEIIDPDELVDMSGRLLHATTWQDLFFKPSPRRRNGSKKRK
jgi:hypothetical protein